MTNDERIKRYLDAIPPCIAGQGGDALLFKVACVLVNGFALERSEVLGWLDYFNEKCQPPWDQHRLAYKCDQALQAVHVKPRGHLLNGGAMAISTPKKPARPIMEGRIPATHATYHSELLHRSSTLICNRSETDVASVAKSVAATEMGCGVSKTRKKQLDELERQGMPTSDREFASNLLDVFQAKPKPKMPPRFDQENAEKRKKKGIKNCSFQPNTIPTYPWAMWERMEATNDPQWSNPS